VLGPASFLHKSTTCFCVLQRSIGTSMKRGVGWPVDCNRYFSKSFDTVALLAFHDAEWPRPAGALLEPPAHSAALALTAPTPTTTPTVANPQPNSSLPPPPSFANDGRAPASSAYAWKLAYAWTSAGCGAARRAAAAIRPRVEALRVAAASMPAQEEAEEGWGG
jgi:hypothetical protein